MRFSGFLLFVAAGAMAIAQSVGGIQSPKAPGGAEPGQTEAKCAIEGVVLNAATNSPLRKVRISLPPQRTSAMPEGPVTIATTETDGDGKFALRDIAPGRYQLSASRAGFLLQNYGAKKPEEPGTVLSLTTGQHVEELVIKIQPHAAINGKVVDEDGDPLMHADIQVLRNLYVQGRRQLLMVNSSATNDLGEYRVFGLAPGKYVVRAAYRNDEQSNAADHSGGAPKPEENYAPVYYPGTPDPRTATLLEVATGADMRGIDFRIRKARATHVSGKVNLPSGPDTLIVLNLDPRGVSGGPSYMPAPIRPDNPNFVIRGVLPGSYNLSTRTVRSGQTLMARVPIEVGTTPIENVEITLQAAPEVKGVVRLIGKPNGQIRRLRFSLGSEESRFPGMGVSVSTVNVNGEITFTIPNMLPGVYHLGAIGLGPNAYLKSVRIGDQEFPPHQIDFTHGVPATMEVIVSWDGATVEGNVSVEKDGRAAEGALVVLAATDREGSDRLHTTTTDQKGYFRMSGIRPGEYKLYSFEGVEEGAYADPDFLKLYEGKSETVSLEERDSKTKQLKLISVQQN